MKKGFVICKKVDGFGNDEYVYLERGVFENDEDAKCIIKKIMKEEHLEELKFIKEEIEERIEALEKGSYITGAHDNICLSITSSIAKNSDSARYGDFYLREIKIRD